jgi:hypothetical protein
MTSFGGAVTTTIPSVPDDASTVILAANPFRRYLSITNLGSNTFAISLTGATITSATPSTANPVIPFGSGAQYANYFEFVPTGAITAYQNSGGALEELLVIEG